MRKLLFFVAAVLLSGGAMATTQEPAPQTEDEPVFVAEEMPKFKGGDLKTFRLWVQERIVYPRFVISEGPYPEGKVIVSFVIEHDGSLTNTTEIASPDKMLTNEVIRVLETSPKWTPGKNGGKPVRVKFILPIDFLLNH